VAAEDSDGHHVQRAPSATLDPLAAELEALGLAGKGLAPERSAAEPELDSEHDANSVAEGSSDGGLDEAMLDRLVGTHTEASAAGADGDTSSREDGAPAGPVPVDTNGVAEDTAQGPPQAELDGAASAALRQHRAKANGLSVNGQSVGDSGGSAAAAEPDGRPMTKRQKRKQKGAQPAQAAEVPRLACGVCGSEFESRTQLFKHIASSGHALLKT
jgi:DnaJ family protein A protein 5